MSAEIELISTMGEKKLANRPPIQMEFQVTFYLIKNLIVSYQDSYEFSSTPFHLSAIFFTVKLVKKPSMSSFMNKNFHKIN
jgi:hypothetical protein